MVVAQRRLSDSPALLRRSRRHVSRTPSSTDRAHPGVAHRRRRLINMPSLSPHRLPSPNLRRPRQLSDELSTPTGVVRRPQHLRLPTTRLRTA